MTYSLVGQAAGSGSALVNAGHYEFLRTIQHFACGQLTEDSYSGVGNGKIKRLAVMAKTAPKETWTITKLAGGEWSVVGSTSGAKGNATEGVLYWDDPDTPLLQFIIQPGGTAYGTGDAYVLSATNGIRTLYDDAYTGTGNGEILNMVLLDEVTEDWTLTCTGTAPDGGTFSVTGSVSGAQGPATVGTPYGNGIIKFLITDGTIDFAINDTFTLKAKAQELPVSDRWLVKRWDDTIDDYELYLEGPGIPGIGAVYCQFVTVQSEAGNYYNLAFSTAQGFVSSNDWGSQPNIGAKSCLMWDFNIPYNLRISPRQIAFEVDADGREDFGYVGFYSAYFDPTQNPYPAAQLGSLNGRSTTRYDNETRNNGSKPTGSGATGTGTLVKIDGEHVTPDMYPVENTNFSDPAHPVQPTQTNTQSYSGTGNGQLVRYNARWNAPLETWTITKLAGGDWSVVGSISGAQGNATEGVPYDNGILEFEIEAGGTAFVAGDEFTHVIGQEYSMERMAMVMPGQGLVGELEGVFWLTGFSNAKDNTIVKNGVTHAVIRDVARTGFNDFIALALD